MSDFPQGSDWWKATDGRWYPPPATGDGEPPEAPSPKPDPVQQWGRRIGFGVFAVAMAAIVWAFIQGPEEPKSPAELAAEYRPSAADAERMCRNDVSGKLKAPGTASFGDVRSRISGDYDDDQWTVTGWVDAQNSFGATVRSEWICQATHRGGGRWGTLATIG